MDSMLVQYILFILGALVLIGAVIALNRWIYRRSKPVSPNAWMELDTRRADAREDPLANTLIDEDEDDEEVELHLRARQNGHHAESQKPPI